MAKIDLFQAGQEGYEVYRLPGMVVTPKDAVLAFCEARKSRRGDWGTIDILEDADIKELACIYSPDTGTTPGIRRGQSIQSGACGC